MKERAAPAARSFQCFLPQTLAKSFATGFKARSGRLAQLEEHLVYTERVGGSSPSAPTILPKLNSVFPKISLSNRHRECRRAPSQTRYHLTVHQILTRCSKTCVKPHLTLDPPMCQGYHPRLAEAFGFQSEDRAGVAQSVRVPACHAGGRGFEPRRSRQSFISKPFYCSVRARRHLRVSCRGSLGKRLCQ